MTQARTREWGTVSTAVRIPGGMLLTVGLDSGERVQVRVRWTRTTPGEVIARRCHIGRDEIGQCPDWPIQIV